MYMIEQRRPGLSNWLDDVNKYVDAGADVAKSVDQAVDTGTEIYRRFDGSTGENQPVPVQQDYTGTTPPQTTDGSIQVDYGGVQGSVNIGEKKDDTMTYVLIGAGVLLAFWLIS